MIDSSKVSTAPEILGSADVRALHLVLIAGLVAVSYYAGAKFGFALTFDPYPASLLWPPNSLLLAALLLLPTRLWWLPLLAALPAHLLVELQSGVPTAMVLGWFVSNCSEALIGAACVRQFLWGESLQFDSYRHVCIFMVGGVVVAPLLSSFLDVALVTLIGWGKAGFWDLLEMRFFSNALATLIIVPVVLAWARVNWRAWRAVPIGRQLETGALFLGLLAAGFLAFDRAPGTYTIPALLYAPLPFLLWGAVRLGPKGISASLLAVAALAIWGALHDLGPFISGSPMQDTRSVQLFLIAMAVPLLLFAALTAERRRTRKALQISEERALKVFHSIPDPIVIVRRSDFRIVDVNDRWEALFGHARSEAIGRTTLELGLYADPEDRKTYLRLSERGLARDFAADLRDRNGRIHQTVMSGENVEIAGTRCLIKIIRDVTRQKFIEREAQEQRVELVHLSRVAMLGELSGALAHELNQPLTAILSNAQAAQRLLAADHVDAQDLREILRDIVSEDKRAGNVIRRLRALFKKGDTQFQTLDANDLAREVLALARGSLTSRDIHVVTELCAHPVFVSGDRVQLQQVLLNLVTNAWEAMGEPGSTRVLTLKTMPSDEGQVQIFVVDGGAGIPAELMEEMFSPFFTTKAQGLGLGLSISRSIVAAHAGQLLARNNPGRGATFRIVLPAVHGT